MKINLTRIFILVCLVLFFATNVTAGRTDRLARLKAKKAHQLEQLIQSAEQGNAEAQEKLGEHYRDKGMYDQAVYWLQQAANQNIASAQFSLSIFYYKGLSVEQNQEKAISLIKQAATNGYSEAQTIIGKEAVKNEDFSTAAVWFEKAAEQNDPTAMIFLSNLFYSGKGVELKFRVS
jgi:TPR repeat protein